MYRSVFILVLLAFSATALTLTHPNPVDPVQERCSNEHGVSRHWIDTKMRNLTEPDVADLTTKCFIACMWRGRGMLNEDGTMNGPLVARNLPGNIENREDVARAFTECAKQKGENMCDTVAKTILCLYANEAFRAMHPIGTPFQASH